MNRASSLRARLLMPLVTGTALFWMAVAAYGFVDTHHEVDELFDAQLAQSARLLLIQAEGIWGTKPPERSEGSKSAAGSERSEVLAGLAGSPVAVGAGKQEGSQASAGLKGPHEIGGAKPLRRSRDTQERSQEDPHERDWGLESSVASTAPDPIDVRPPPAERLPVVIDEEAWERQASPELFVGKAGHPYEQKLYFQIWDHQGRLLYRSSQLTPTSAMSLVKVGYSENRIAGADWRVFALWNEAGRLQIQIGQQHAVREELVMAIATHLVLPTLLAIPMMAMLLWWAVRRGLRPLQAIAGAVQETQPDPLTPIAIGATPTEARPLVDAINRLLARLGGTLERERRFTADAAHELRTPLAGMRAQAQLALQTSDETMRHHALEQVLAGEARMSRLVHQLLTLARLEPQAQLHAATSVPLRPVAERVMAEEAPRALQKDIQLSLECSSTDLEPSCDLETPGREDLLEVLLRNLLENAIRHTPEGGRVRLQIVPTEGGARLLMEDSGPGIPEGERPRVRQRFHRLVGAGGSGAGLGLSIVTRIVALHQGRLELTDSDDLGGLKASVFLPTQVSGEDR